MNPWLDRWLWISAAILFAGLSLSKALVSIGLGFLALGAIMHLLSSGWSKHIEKFKPLLALSLFYGFYFLSVFSSEDFGEGFSELMDQHAFVSIPIIFLVLYQWFKNRIESLLKIFLAACVFHSLVTIGLFLFPEATVAQWVGQFEMLQPYPELTDRLKFGLYTPFIERLNLSYLIGFAILYLLHLLIKDKWNVRRVIQLLVLIIAIILIGARGAQLALILGFFVGSISYMIDLLKRRELPTPIYQQKLISGITIILLLMIGGPFLAYKTIPAVQKRYAQMQWELRLINNGEYKNEAYQYFTSLSRIRAWTNGWHIAKSSPLFGVGIGDYRQALRIENDKYDDLVPVHNQNFFLYLWGAAGIFALLVFLFGIWKYVRSFRGNSNTLVHLVYAYMAFIGFSCTIDAFIIYHIGSCSVMLFLSSLFTLNLVESTKVD